MSGNFDLRVRVKWRHVCIKNVVLTNQTSVVFKCLNDSERRMTLKFCFWPYYNAVHRNLNLRQFISIFHIEQIGTIWRELQKREFTFWNGVFVAVAVAVAKISIIFTQVQPNWHIC